MNDATGAPPTCLLTMIFPVAMEERVVDELLANPRLASGFTTWPVDGHGRHTGYATRADEVRGRSRRVRMEVATREEDARALLEQLAQALPGGAITWWVTALASVGRI